MTLLGFLAGALGWIAFFVVLATFTLDGKRRVQVRRRVLVGALLAAILAFVLSAHASEDGDVLMPMWPSEAQCAEWGTDTWDWWFYGCWGYYV